MHQDGDQCRYSEYSNDNSPITTNVPLIVCTVRLLTDMAKRTGILCELILSAELSEHFRPTEEAYLRAAELLYTTLNQITMVMAHEMGLEVASEASLPTAYVYLLSKQINAGSSSVRPLDTPSSSYLFSKFEVVRRTIIYHFEVIMATMIPCLHVVRYEMRRQMSGVTVWLPDLYRW